METQTPPHFAAPNTGRMLDYWLGGSHHSPIDVTAAQAFEAVLPQFPEIFRVLRAFIGRASRHIREHGVERFLVLGAGVPTQGNVHEAVPGARVLYTDLDPENVETGKRLLAGVPNVGYAFCDAADLATLDRAEVERVLGSSGPLGIIMIGVAAFIEDARLRATFQALYDLAPAGSFLAFDFDGTEGKNYPELLEMMGDEFRMHSPEEFAPLLGPWKVTDEGIQPVSEWRDPGAEPFPPFMYGGVAVKE
ncbi:MAG TPA: SAM-dependent methyltransferase [Longimicrobium sp.]|nr:SAM-dependent methyltransferase [Longimicrobium sp.]